MPCAPGASRSSMCDAEDADFFERFDGFNRFTWFNMGRITKDDRCLIKTIKTENISHKHNK